MDEAGGGNWASGIKSIIFKFGYRFVWISQDIGDTNLFLNGFSQRLKDTTVEYWCKSKY